MRILSEKDARTNVEKIIEQIQKTQTDSDLSDIMRGIEEEQVTITPEIQKTILKRAHDLACQCKRGALLDESRPNLSWIAQVPELLHTASFQNLLRSYESCKKSITESFIAQFEKPVTLSTQHEILLLEIIQVPILAESLMKDSDRLILTSLADSIRNATDPSRIASRVAYLGNLIQYPTILFAINSRAKDLVKVLGSKTSLEISRSLVNALLVLAEQALYKDNVKDFENIGLDSTLTESILSKIKTKLQKKEHIKRILQSGDSDKIRDFLERLILNLGWRYTRFALADIGCHHSV